MLPTSEPIIKVGIIQRAKKIIGFLKGSFVAPWNRSISGDFFVEIKEGSIRFQTVDQYFFEHEDVIKLTQTVSSSFAIHDVTIGIQFHWERREDHEFHGSLYFKKDEGETITLINEVHLEEYLESVISSEMNENAPFEFLKAHAITSRSWLVSMLQREESEAAQTKIERRTEEGVEIIRWDEREQHKLFDVCADDHCQRYHGITRIISTAAKKAVQETRGQFILHNDTICDARYSKSCGGRTELFRSAWEDIDIPYLASTYDGEGKIQTESDANRWILSTPPAYCNTDDKTVLETILPEFDRETKDFFRWKVSYTRKELEEIIFKKSGIDFGRLNEILPIERGPSGRITRLKIVGSKETVIVGKELEIRRWLAPSHLYSSAFVVETKRNSEGIPEEFIFHGAGWGHGVGLCQIGAAVMALKGKKAEEILHHYFHGIKIQKIYE